MPRLPSVPTYRLHKQSGQAIVTLRDGLGGRRDILLGVYNSPESRAEYARIISEWENSAHRLPGQQSKDVSVNEVMLAYLRFAEGYYMKNGKPTSQIVRIKSAIRVLRQLYGTTRAEDFGPQALKAVRAAMLKLSCGRCQGKGKRQRDYRRKGEKPVEKVCSTCNGTKVYGWNRRLTNQSVGCIRLAFKWATSEELISPTVLHGLQSLLPLKEGRCEAREPVDVRPVADAVVEATLPHANHVVAAMIQVQRLTGARPGEVCVMRPVDVDRSGPVWAFTPHLHKTQHHKKRRIVFVGPRAQAVLLPFLEGREPGAYCFSPREATKGWREAQRKARKSKVQPSHVSRAKPEPRRPPGERYHTGSLRQAIERACIRAGVAPWHPHQLRHAAATAIRAAGDLDGARTVLGHSSIATSEIYGERDAAKASEIIGRIG